MRAGERDARGGKPSVVVCGPADGWGGRGERGWSVPVRSRSAVAGRPRAGWNARGGAGVGGGRARSGRWDPEGPVRAGGRAGSLSARRRKGRERSTVRSRCPAPAVPRIAPRPAPEYPGTGTRGTDPHGPGSVSPGRMGLR
ncbi:hypothetical protein GCM10027160_08730 [Streptomyces calidiresistens]